MRLSSRILRSRLVVWVGEFGFRVEGCGVWSLGVGIYCLGFGV